jgi:hypothetical protein
MMKNDGKFDLIWVVYILSGIHHQWQTGVPPWVLLYVEHLCDVYNRYELQAEFCCSLDSEPHVL